MPEPKQITLADIAAIFTATGPEFHYFHGKLFSFIPPESDKFAAFISGLQLRRSAFPNSHPATMLIGKLGGLVPIGSKQVMAVEGGQLRILAQVASLKLPDCDYLAIISPVEKNEAGTTYKLGFESINFLRSLVSPAFGKLPFYTWVADFDFDANGTIAIPGEVIRMPLHGDLFKIPDIDLANEVTTRLAAQQADYRQRLQRACNFLDMAMDQKD